MHSEIVSLPWVLIAAAIGTLVALVISAQLGLKTLSHALDPMVYLSTGVLLGTSLLHLLPEALDRGMNHHSLFTWLLVGLLFFFVLEKFALMRHSHHHEHDGHDHHHGFDRHEAGKGGALIVIGDSIHNFADGMLIASAFLVDFKLGLVTTLSIALHEIPQQTGDFIVLLNAGIQRRRAFLLMAVAGLAAILGAWLGYEFMSTFPSVLPVALVLASASFLYVAVADLIPHMQQRLDLRDGLKQLVLIAVGVAIVALMASLLHGHH